MKVLNRAALWFWLLTKRLLKKPVFPVLLLCVPLLSGAMALAARQENGIVSVALVCETEEAEAQRSTQRLLHAKSLVRCTLYGSEAEALDALRRAEVDAAWIFSDGAREELLRFVDGRRTHGIVRVVEREDTVFLRLAREQLAAAIYPEVSRELFRDHLVTQLGAPEDVSWETLEKYYSVRTIETPYIVFFHTDGSVQELSSELLVAPVRGLLALLLLLAGLASCLYCYRDEEDGVFLRLPTLRRRLLPLLCHFCAALPVACAALLALRFAGLLTGWARETLAIVFYCLALSAFCELLRKLCRGEARLGALIPALLIITLLLCPVFFDVQSVEPLRCLLPTYHYLRAVSAQRYLWLLPLYAAAVSALAALLPERSPG